jgi:hypothetical protein
MSITITDPVLLAQLRAVGAVEFKDPDGNVLGVYAADGLGKLPPPGVTTTFTDEERAEMRKGPSAARAPRPGHSHYRTACAGTRPAAASPFNTN